MIVYAKRPEPLRLPPDEYKKLHTAVLKRDKWKCRVPGCLARSGLHVHHIIFRSQGGEDTPENLITVCDFHHTWIHKHAIVIIGTALKAVWKFYREDC